VHLEFTHAKCLTQMCSHKFGCFLPNHNTEDPWLDSTRSQGTAPEPGLLTLKGNELSSALCSFFFSFSIQFSIFFQHGEQLQLCGAKAESRAVNRAQAQMSAEKPGFYSLGQSCARCCWYTTADFPTNKKTDPDHWTTSHFQY